MNTTPQQAYIQKQKEASKKLINCWVDAQTIDVLNKLKIHYNAPNRGSLLSTIITKHLEFIAQEGEKPSWKDQIENRLDVIEAQLANPSKKLKTKKSQVQVVEEQAFQYDDNSGDFTPDNKAQYKKQLLTFIKNHKEKGLTYNEMATILNNKGLHSLRDMPFDIKRVKQFWNRNK